MSDTTTRAREIRAELDKLAPYPKDGEVTARGLARYLAMEAQVVWTRFMGMDHPGTPADIGIMTGHFAAAQALLEFAEVNAPLADVVAGEIREAFEPPGIGECLYEILDDDAEAIAKLAQELAEATVKPAVQPGVVVDPEDLRTLMRLAEGYAARDPLRLPPNDSCREALDRLAAAVKP